MSNTGLPIFDETIRQTNSWLNDILDHIGSEEWSHDDRTEEHRRRAYNALRAVLLTLRDRIPVELAAHLSAQLPLLVRGTFYEQYRPAHQPLDYREVGAFYAHVDEASEPQFHFGAVDSTRAVFAVLSKHLPEGIIAKVREALPKDVRQAWASLEAA